MWRAACVRAKHAEERNHYPGVNLRWRPAVSTLRWLGHPSAEGQIRLPRVLESQQEGHGSVQVSSGDLRRLGGSATSQCRGHCQGRPAWLETEELEAEIEALDRDADVVEIQARDLADELIREKSDAVRIRLREKEAEWKATRERLRALRARRDALARRMYNGGLIHS